MPKPASRSSKNAWKTGSEKSVTALHQKIATDLSEAGRGTPYQADANENDPRYKGYGVRAPAMRAYIKANRAALQALSQKQALSLATKLIRSGYGEQKTVALYLLNQHRDYFIPPRFDELETLVRDLHGWSKIDEVSGTLLQALLQRHSREMINLLQRWNTDTDQWLRRACVVVFTRKTALTGLHTDTALQFCHQLRHDPEDLVRKGIGWCLKDLLRCKKDRKKVLAFIRALRAEKVSSVITLYAIKDLKGDERAEILAL